MFSGKQVAKVLVGHTTLKVEDRVVVGVQTQSLLNHLLALFILVSFEQLLSLNLEAFHVSIEVKFESLGRASLRRPSSIALVNELSSIICTLVLSIDVSNASDTGSRTIFIPIVHESFACGSSGRTSAGIG